MVNLYAHVAPRIAPAVVAPDGPDSKLIVRKRAAWPGGSERGSVTGDVPRIADFASMRSKASAARRTSLWKALNGQRGKSLVFLAPCAATKLVCDAYSWGARNVELHVAQSTAPIAHAKGIVFPTFMPETAWKRACRLATCSGSPSFRSLLFLRLFPIPPTHEHCPTYFPPPFSKNHRRRGCGHL